METTPLLAFLYLIIIIGVILLIFIFIREVVLWYWKINKIVELLEINNKYLQRLIVDTKPHNNENKVVKNENIEEIDISKTYEDIPDSCILTDDYIIKIVDIKSKKSQEISRKEWESMKSLAIFKNYRVVSWVKK